MRSHILPRDEKYISRRRFRKRWNRVLILLCAVVVFCTTYALIIPAVTMEWECSIPEHTHSDACYTQASSVHEVLPNCTAETLGIHQHTPDCYDVNGEPVCGYADFVVHTHDSACYDDNGGVGRHRLAILLW